MLFFHPQLSYINSNQQFKLADDDGEMHTYTAGWLDHASQAELDDLGFVRAPAYDPATQILVEFHTGWQVRDKTPEELASETGNAHEAKIHAAWQMAHNQCIKAADPDARSRFILWLIDPAASDMKKARIFAILQYIDQVWAAYATYKAQVYADDPNQRYSPPTEDAPYTFWDVVEA